MLNWKAAVPDGLQGYWLRSRHKRRALHLKTILQTDVVPKWMVEGKTVFLKTDRSEGNGVCNYRPIV